MSLPTEKQHEWHNLLLKLEEVVGKRPADLNAVLFLIGVQELGQGTKHFSKEEKQDLMHIALCKLFSYSGHYTFSYTDEDGWPHYDLVKPIPHGSLQDQATYIKEHVIEYFKEHELID